MKIIRRSSEDKNVRPQHPTSEPYDRFEDAVLAGYRRGKRQVLDVVNRQHQRTMRFLWVLVVVGAALCLVSLVLQFATPDSVDGAAQPQTVTYTLTTTASVHPAAGGGCTSSPTTDHFTASLWDDAGVQRLAPLSAGRRAGKACVFTATMPMLRDARWFAVAGAYHEVPTGSAAMGLSATDGQWRPVKSLAGAL
jgi:hypothetical protein